VFWNHQYTTETTRLLPSFLNIPQAENLKTAAIGSKAFGQFSNDGVTRLTPVVARPQMQMIGISQNYRTNRSQ